LNHNGTTSTTMLRNEVYNVGKISLHPVHPVNRVETTDFRRARRVIVVNWN